MASGTLTALILALLTPAITPIPPGDPLPPPRGDAGPDDIVALTGYPGATPLPDCGALAWSHHPLDPARSGRHCAAWITPAARPPILAVARPGEPPAALLPIVYRPQVGTDGVITAEAAGPDPELIRAVTAALARWSASTGQTP